MGGGLAVQKTSDGVMKHEAFCANWGQLVFINSVFINKCFRHCKYFRHWGEKTCSMLLNDSTRISL